jgi:hypothetical protein
MSDPMMSDPMMSDPMVSYVMMSYMPSRTESSRSDLRMKVFIKIVPNVMFALKRMVDAITCRVDADINSAGCV